MLLLYLYDIKAKDKRKFNRIKRLFYYHMGKLPLKKELWKTKSAVAVEIRMERTMDLFFRRFGKAIVVYKVVAETIEKL